MPLEPAPITATVRERVKGMGLSGAAEPAPRANYTPVFAALWSALASAVLGLGGCGSDSTVNLDPTLANVQAEVFTPSCAVSGCHDSVFHMQDQDLSPGKAFAGLVNVRSTEDPTRFRVEPGAPERSYLVAKLRGGPNISGARMPLNQPAVDEQSIQLVERWIAAGALP
jgi:hypothetical protein